MSPRLLHSTLNEYDRIKHAAIKYVDQMYLHDISLGTFCDSYGWSPRKVQRALRAYGTSWREMLRSRRMKEAIVLLEETDLEVRHVAMRCGYLNPAQFARAFRSETGCKPREYRQNVRQEERLAAD